jgi:hypothetical protein
MVRIVGIAAAGRHQTRNASAIEDAHAFWLRRLAGPVQTVLRSLVENLLIACPASVSAVPVTLVIANVVTTRALPHLAIVERLERTGDAAIVVIGGGATFTVNVSEKELLHLSELILGN